MRAVRPGATRRRAAALHSHPPRTGLSYGHPMASTRIALRRTGTGLLTLFGFAACAESRLPEPRPEAQVVVVPRGTASIARADRDPIADAAVDVTVAIDAAVDAAPAKSPEPLVVRNEPTRLPSGRTLPGPCVTPSVHAAVKALTRGLELDAEFFAPRDVEIDLDGDGNHDIFLNGGASRDTVTLHLYVRRNGCGYDVGSIEAVVGVVEALTTMTQGLVDLRVTQDLCEAKTRSLACEVVYKFDGKRYRPTSYKATQNSMRGM